MGLRMPGSSEGSGKLRKLIYLLVIIIAVALVALFVYSHFHKLSNNNTNTGTDLTKNQILSGRITAAENSSKTKDYDQAVQYYYSAASSAYAQKDYKKAKSLIAKCISEIPDQNVPWYVYEGQAKIAKTLNDKELQKSSLVKALDKASAPSSGVSQANIDNMKKQLEGINL